MHFNCRAACLVYCLGLWTKAARNSFINGWSFTRPFLFTMQPASLPLVGGILPWWFLTKHRTKSTLKCNHALQFVIPDHTHLAFWKWDAIFHSCGVRITGVKAWKIKCRDFKTWLLSVRMCLVSSPLLLSSYVILRSNRQYFMYSRCSCACQRDINVTFTIINSVRAGLSGVWNPLGAEIFPTRPDRSRGPRSLLHSGFLVSFTGVKRPEPGDDQPPHLAPSLKKV